MASGPFDWPWPAPADDGGASHLVTGLRLPDLSMAATLGGVVDLSRQPGRTAIVCYPWTGVPGGSNPPDWDHIPGAHGSTPELEGFRNLHAAFRSLEMVVFGVSTQTAAYQSAFAERLNLPFALLSDERFTVQRALRLPTLATGGVLYLRRLTIIARDGLIERIFYPVHPPQSHAREVAAWCSASASYALEAKASEP
jgi:peroxiredoxin